MTCNNQTVGNIEIYCYENTLQLIDFDPVNNTRWSCIAYSDVNDLSTQSSIVHVIGILFY